jgi:peptide-methionine (S)-S-oxide reductase
MERGPRLAIAVAGVAIACGVLYLAEYGPSVARVPPTPAVTARTALPPDTRPAPPGLAKATFASGCFWCTEADFDAVPGVLTTTSGYTGGARPHPTYEQVSSGATGHVEALEVIFDPARVGYQALLDHYWRNVDPFNDRGQFCDYGEQYRPVIFVHDGEQRALAEATRLRLQSRFGRTMLVPITTASAFYPAEDYHQDYHTRNPVRYRYYRWSCGRNQRLAEIWAAAPALGR